MPRWPGKFALPQAGKVNHRCQLALTLLTLLAVLFLSQAGAPGSDTPAPASSSDSAPGSAGGYAPAPAPGSESPTPANSSASAPGSAGGYDPAPGSESPAPNLTPDFKTRFPPGATVAVIRIEGLIYDFTLESLQRLVERAKESGATAIAIELDTPGGILTSALKISRYLRGLDVPTVAWVHSEAYSAGILIAAAADGIVMSPASAAGDCAPIVPGTSLEPTERAKALSPLLSEFAASATRNHYDYVMFQAMCVLGVEVYQVQHTQTNQRRLVNEADYKVMVDAMDPSAAERSLKSWLGLDKDSSDLSKISATVLPEERGQWKLIKKMHDGATLLTVDQSKAVDLGLAQTASISTDDDLQNYLQAKNVLRIWPTWSERLAGWLTSPAVRAILILALLLGAYAEFQSPGLGLPGAVALLALIALIGAPFLVGLAQIWHLVLLLTGFILLMIEIFVIPGFGFVGVTGILLMLAGLVLAAVPSSGSGPMPLPDPSMIRQLEASALWTTAAIVASMVGAYFLTKNLKNIPGLSRLVLRSASSSAGATAIQPSEHVSGDEVLGGAARIHPGAKGRAVTPLHPSGGAEIGGFVVDVVTAGEWIERGKTVIVTSVEGNRIVVTEDLG
ncbi:MAG: hypothetical protein IT443_03495 [Phycisphaeraceae bacterium]|nr:hypothetical protein [Phycisphaeraceae bacterium]